MYDQVYEAMVRSNVAIKLDEAVWVNKDNNIVQSKEEAFSRQTQYYIMHPDHLVFVDEVGDNTSQQNDGNADGEKFIVDKDRCAMKKSFLPRQPVHGARIHPCKWQFPVLCYCLLIPSQRCRCGSQNGNTTLV